MSEPKFCKDCRWYWNRQSSDFHGYENGVPHYEISGPIYCTRPRPGRIDLVLGPLQNNWVECEEERAKKPPKYCGKTARYWESAAEHQAVEQKAAQERLREREKERAKTKAWWEA